MLFITCELCSINLRAKGLSHYVPRGHQAKNEQFSLLSIFFFILKVGYESNKLRLVN